MKTRLMLILLIFLLFTIVFPLKAMITTALADSEGKNDTIWLVTHSTSSAHGAYQLTGINWSAEGVSVGGDYKLLSPLSPSESSGGCCCTYLPCVFKDW